MEDFRYEKIGKYTFLKVACDALVANNLENGQIVERPEETPLEMHTLNFDGEKENLTTTSVVVDNREEEPLDLPQVA